MPPPGDLISADEWPSEAIAAAAAAALLAGRASLPDLVVETVEQECQAHASTAEPCQAHASTIVRARQHTAALASWIDKHVQLSCGDSFQGCDGVDGGGGGQLPPWLRRASAAEAAPTLLYAPCAVFTPEMMAALARWVQRLKSGSLVLTTTQRLPALAGVSPTGQEIRGRGPGTNKRRSKVKRRSKAPSKKHCGRLELIDTLQLRYARGKLVVHVYQMPL